MTGNSFIPLSTSIRDITNKLQSATILPAIPPLMQTSIHEIFNVNSDHTSVINAEEAMESPDKHKQFMNSQSGSSSPVTNSQKKFDIYNKIGQQDFDDTILFKHHKRKKKQSDKTKSTSNLSSSSSDDRETSINHPTLMNMSAVGGLPDLRSPDSILSDIKHKERILADVLNLDKVRVTENELKNMEKEKCLFDINKEVESAVDDESCSNASKHNENTLVFENQSTSKDLNESFEMKSQEEEAIIDEDFSVKPFKKIMPSFDKVRENSKPLNIPGKII